MSYINGGGPAFPAPWVNDGDQNNTAPNGAVVPPGGVEQLPGMTLRDYFAAKALSGLLSCPDESVCDASDPEGVERERREYAKNMAHDAYRYADAMLKARQS